MRANDCKREASFAGYPKSLKYFPSAFAQSRNEHAVQQQP